MDALDLPPDLVERFKEGRVALFVGAGCCRGAGLPTWGELLKTILDQYEATHLLSKDDRGRLKAWMKRAEDYPRVAELFKNRSPDQYRQMMQKIFDPLRASSFAPPRYFNIFRRLPVSRILTTNFDKLIETALGSAWGSLTWQDYDELPRFLRESRPLVFHIHGRADRYGTLVHTYTEYQLLQGHEGIHAREFLKRIFESNSIIFLGYSLSDPVIRWLREQLLSDWGITQPDWSLLAPNPTEEQRVRQWKEKGLRLLGYHLDEKDDLNVAHEEGIFNWFKHLADHLGIAAADDRDLFSTSPELSENGYFLVNKSFLDRQPAATPDLCRRFYHGEPVRWSLVRDGYTARRRATDEALLSLEGEGLRAVLLSSPGGEGKSTILMQIGLELLHHGFEVFYFPEPEGDIFGLVRRSRMPLALIIDHADELRNIAQLLQACERRAQRTRIVLAARSHEWKYSQKGSSDVSRIVKVISVAKLNRSEASEIASRLIETGTVEGRGFEELTEALFQDTNGFLLAAMLTATHGEPLARILADVIHRISEWPGSEELLTALACVVALESRKRPSGERCWCSLRLFAEVMGISRQAVYGICARLVGEVSLHPRGGYKIETRHPVIASTLFPILFRSDAPYLDEIEIHERILRAVGRLSRDNLKAGERGLLSILPLAYKKEGDIYRARQLFHIATEADPGQVPTWQAWAHMESESGEAGSLDRPYTARWLFKKATEVDPKDGPAWQAWAIMEGKLGNIGSLDDPFTSRWLFKKATEADPNQAPTWQAWALLEDTNGNRGELNITYSARWLFLKAVEVDPTHAPSWQAWAVMESSGGNLGLINQKYTARWLFLKATQADPDDALSWQAWARMEGDSGTLGDAEQPHTARWLFAKAINVNPEDAPSWHAWAECERKAGYLKAAADILERGLKRCPKAPELLALREKYSTISEDPAAFRIKELIASGDCQKAEAALKDALFANPEAPDLLELHRQWRQRCR